MREYFTVTIKENSNESMGLLTEKLNSGYTVDRFYEVGKMGIFILEKWTPRVGENNLVDAEPSGLIYQTEAPTLTRRG